MTQAAVVELPAKAPTKKPDPLRDLVLGKFEPPAPSPEIDKAQEQVKAASVQRAIEIDLAILGLDGRKIESVQRDWPGVDLASMLEDPEIVARVDAWAENPVIENFALALQERRMAAKARSVLETSLEETGTPGQARELLDLLTKGRQVRDPEKPVRRLRYVFGQSLVETPFSKTTIDVLGRDPAAAFIDVCRAMHVRDDAEIAAVLGCLREPMSRITLGGW